MVFIKRRISLRESPPGSIEEIGGKEFWEKEDFEMDWEGRLKRISEWWEGENQERPCIAFSLKKKDIPPGEINAHWDSPEVEPEFEALTEGLIQRIKSFHYFGEALPVLPHTWGERGTPMVLASWLGGRVKFGQDTVWIEPVIKRLDEFEIKFDEENIWFKRSLEFFKVAVEKSREEYFPWLPDFGDFLTVFSLLRGAEPLLFDLLENKEKILEERDRFLKFWPLYHERFWRLYSSKFPGDISWASWAPGKTYACQCDFSTMISPLMFQEFVVPEIESLGRYLDYIIWHLDGPEEIKHLDILLELPQIKAIQWVPGAGKPPAASPRWLPMLKKIKEKGKRLWVEATKEKEVEILIRELSPEGLFISGGFTGRSKEEAEDFLKWVVKISREVRKRRVSS